MKKAGLSNLVIGLKHLCDVTASFTFTCFSSNLIYKYSDIHFFVYRDIFLDQIMLPD